jgi:hypothetical protein
MGMKEKKESVDVIVDKLKNVKDLPYKSGSWERFRSEQKLGPARRSLKIWYAAASVLLFLGLATGVWWLGAPHDGESPKVTQVLPSGNGDGNSSEIPRVEIDERTAVSRVDIVEEPIADFVYAGSGVAGDHYPSPLLDGLEKLPEVTTIRGNVEVSLPTLNRLPEQRQMYGHYEEFVLNMPSAGVKNQTLASIAASHTGSMAWEEPDGRGKGIRFGDRFEMGVFVSPYATSNQMNVGAGLALSYKLSKTLSVRTGASYNSYEIQMVKNPIEAGSAEAVTTEADMVGRTNASVANVSYQQQLIIPNVNAITGFVRSVDIPLEIKVNDGRGSFYATAGMSYSAILNQQRNAHYVENLNVETFADGYPENAEQASAAVKPVTRIIESSEENVNSKGYSGFVNFSVGKNIRVNKKVGFSVEPYLKIPVGQYRRAETDYTNGGIRVMTNF